MSNKEKIKVGFLVSYDYKYLENSLPRIYKDADIIALAIDKNRETWSGNKFEIPNSFFEWLKDFDTENKIEIYEDSFYVPELAAIDCDTRERNKLAEFMGEGGWHFQIDSDEYFLDFAKFVRYVHSLNYNKKTLVYAEWVSMFKEDLDGFFLINSNETFPVATNCPVYNYCRKTTNAQVEVYTKHVALHQSWARSEDEIEYKIKNWGHKDDADTTSYFNLWKAINKNTYKYIRSFHLLAPWIWQRLEFYNTTDLDSLFEMVKQREETLKIEKVNEEKLKLRDFIPVALYKIKAKIFN